jgi:hypothetical protein
MNCVCVWLIIARCSSLLLPINPSINSSVPLLFSSLRMLSFFSSCFRVVDTSGDGREPGKARARWGCCRPPPSRPAGAAPGLISCSHFITRDHAGLSIHSDILYHQTVQLKISFVLVSSEIECGRQMATFFEQNFFNLKRKRMLDLD